VTDAWRLKVSPHLLGRLAQSDERVRVMVRFSGPVDTLRAHGLEVGTVAGGVATATIALRDVPTAARAAEVIYIEASHTLGPDQ
jgi:hypothetical protein